MARGRATMHAFGLVRERANRHARRDERPDHDHVDGCLRDRLLRERVRVDGAARPGGARHTMSGGPDSATSSFSALLRRSRLAAGLTQEELAERAGMSAQAIGRLERGDRQRPYPNTVRRLVDALGLVGDARAAFLAQAPPRLRGRARQRQLERQAKRAADVASNQQATDTVSGDPIGAAASVAEVPDHVDREGLPAFADLPDLPISLTPLLGREGDVARVSALLRDGARLLTLTGPGGVGKTRLSLQAAKEVQSLFPDGVAFVPLASLADTRLVLPTIGGVLGVSESGAQSLAERVQRTLRRRRALLVLDNFEHVLRAAAAVSALLEELPSRGGAGDEPGAFAAAGRT